jgi:phage regulator Rha-like protein
LEEERLKNIKKMMKFKKEYVDKFEEVKPIEKQFEEFSSEKESSKESVDAVSDRQIDTSPLKLSIEEVKEDWKKYTEEEC